MEGYLNDISEYSKRLFDVFTSSQEFSDLHIKEGDFAYFRKNGKLDPTKVGSNDENPEGRITNRIANAILTDIFSLRYGKDEVEQRKDDFIAKGYQEDFAVQITPQVRARVNVYKTLGKIGIALRQIPSTMPDLGKIGLNDNHMRIITGSYLTKREGLILITGQTGSGKSTTLAAMINYINQMFSKHIITIEDPVEFKHTNAKSIISHREVGEGNDTETFFTGLKASLREDPDIILVGEMRDAETALAAIQAAQTGHIVLATLHTNSAAETVTRIVDMFPPEKARGITTSLAQSLLMIMSQKLVPDISETRMLAYELLFNVPTVKGHIINDFDVIDIKINEVLRRLHNEGMVGMPRFLADAVQAGKVKKEVALEYIGGIGSQIDEFKRYVGDLSVRDNA